MKKLSVLFLIAILGLGGWALPAGAEKIRLTDAELDGITAGNFTLPCISPLCVPPPDSVKNIVRAGVGTEGTLMPLMGVFSAGGGTFKGRGNFAEIIAEGGIMSPPTGSFGICVQAFGQFFGVGCR